MNIWKREPAAVPPAEELTPEEVAALRVEHQCVGCGDRFTRARDFLGVVRCPSCGMEQQAVVAPLPHTDAAFTKDEEPMADVELISKAENRVAEIAKRLTGTPNPEAWGAAFTPEQAYVKGLESLTPEEYEAYRRSSYTRARRL
jgi:hypothetical protein